MKGHYIIIYHKMKDDIYFAGLMQTFLACLWTLSEYNMTFALDVEVTAYQTVLK